MGEGFDGVSQTARPVAPALPATERLVPGPILSPAAEACEASLTEGKNIPGLERKRCAFALVYCALLPCTAPYMRHQAIKNGFLLPENP